MTTTSDPVLRLSRWPKPAATYGRGGPVTGYDDAVAEADDGYEFGYWFESDGVEYDHDH